MVAGRLAALAVLTCTGCDVVLGFGGISPVDATIDAGPQIVTGTITRRYLHNDAAGAPATEAVAYAASPVDAYVIGEPTPVPVTWDPTTQQFTFITTGRYRVVQQLVSGVREVQGSAAQLTLDEVRLGHADDALPAAGVTLTYGLAPAHGVGDSERVSTTGVWTSTNPTALPDGTYRLGWSALDELAAQAPATVRPALHDQVVFLRWRALATPDPLDAGVVATVASAVQPLDGSISQGVPTAVPVALTPLTRSTCVYIDAPIAQGIARLSATLDGPGGWAAGNSAWVLFAVALPDVSLDASHMIAYRGASTDIAPAPMMFGNPFPALTPVVVVSAHVQRPRAGGAPPADAYLQVWRPAGCAPVAFPVTDAPLPTGFELGGTDLDTDGVNIAIPDGGTELTWREDAGGAPATLNLVSLIKITGTDRVVVRTYQTAEPRVWLEPALLEDGQAYAFNVQTTTLAPGAAQGDFVTRATSWARVYLDTPTFTAQR